MKLLKEKPFLTDFSLVKDWNLLRGGLVWIKGKRSDGDVVASWRWQEGTTVFRCRSRPGAHLRLTQPVRRHPRDENRPPLQHGVLPRQRERSGPRGERRPGHDMGAEVCRLQSKCTEQVSQSVGLFLCFLFLFFFNCQNHIKISGTFKDIKNILKW